MDTSTATETFSKSMYITPETTPRFLGDRLLLSSRLWFYVRFARVLFRSNRLARIGQYGEQEWIDSSFQIFRDIEGCGGRFFIEGLDNLRESPEPMVLVSNHMSTLETMVFPSIIAPFRSLSFIVKDALVKGFVFGPIMRSRNPVVVGRKKAMADLRVVMTKGEEVLKQRQQSLVIFPQSTRTTAFYPEKFNSMGVKLAKKAGVKILPIAIKTDFWGNGSVIKEFGPIRRKKTIHMCFGKPMSVTGNGKDEHQAILSFIGSQLEKWWAETH